ncbi:MULTISPECIES: cbb3-type cytochrome c oxidase subunit 3 [Microbulbifer]|uniref:Cbb3-type cytochrome c oxidase subunit 3 n=1 Tax=Microbulbifer salipaludis TaxID=187980 RepID=A0ABS3EA58_9GAMM|nr:MULTISPECIES: cbb3-type cytochrome c oxidase subunit 3 [Microbulbifer]MBN8432199.1 cbb3-type cytochrome c oxidase subunit 3 [Microbulbifer salipaludis]
MIDILRQIGVVLGALAFLGVCWWAFSPKRKKRFEEDAKLPFADEQENLDRTARESESTAGKEADKKQQQGQDK